MSRLPPLPRSLAPIVRSDEAARRAVAGSRGPVWILPRAVARPRDEEDVAALVSWSAAEGIRLVPRGGATGMPGGNVGEDVVLELGGLRGVEPPARDRIRAGAGAVAADVDARAREGGRHLPALPSSAPWCTAGGMVATDAAGARSFRYGPTHRWTSALRVVLSSGTVVELDRGRAPVTEAPWGPLREELNALHLPPGPAVSKNSSGYGVERFRAGGDPIQLLVGSEGTLAVVTAVEWTTEPLPDARGVALLGIPEVEVLPEVAALARSRGATACEFFGPRLLTLGGLGGDPRLEGLDARGGVALLEFAGDPEGVDRGLDACRHEGRGWGGARVTVDPAAADALWELRHEASPAIARAAGERRSLQFIEDGVVPIEALPAYVRGVEAALGERGVDGVIFGHAGDGHLHVNPLVDLRDPTWRAIVSGLLDEVTRLVVSLGGSTSGEHGDGRIRAPLLERVWDPAHLDAFRRVKETLDPGGLLNPGVVLPLPHQDPLQGMASGPDLQRAPQPAGSAA